MFTYIKDRYRSVFNKVKPVFSSGASSVVEAALTIKDLTLGAKDLLLATKGLTLTGANVVAAAYHGLKAVAYDVPLYAKAVLVDDYDDEEIKTKAAAQAWDKVKIDREYFSGDLNDISENGSAGFVDTKNSINHFGSAVCHAYNASKSACNAAYVSGRLVAEGLEHAYQAMPSSSFLYSDPSLSKNCVPQVTRNIERSKPLLDSISTTKLKMD